MSALHGLICANRFANSREELIRVNRFRVPEPLVLRIVFGGTETCESQV